MQKVLVIAGPTATGKTTLAIKLAKKFSGEILSADSRQVYRGLDIGTGKDLPKNSKFLGFRNSGLGFYLISGIRLWGYDLANFKENFSVSNYLKATQKIIKDIKSRKKLLIICGGTGLYIKALLEGGETFSIPPDLPFRKKLSKSSPRELYNVTDFLQVSVPGV